MKIQPFANHEQALKFRALRNQVLASNIANADTPNYKARDVEFGAALKNAQSGQLSMQRTSELHISSQNTNAAGAEIKYRVPTQPSLDGNTVQTDVEQAAFAENAVQYRASLAFLDGQIRGLRYALRGTD
jgi:flagellar basal-body rod protein FlgB